MIYQTGGSQDTACKQLFNGNMRSKFMLAYQKKN